MKKNFLYLFLLLFIYTYAYCDKINEYPILKIKTILIGKKNNEIGIEKYTAGGPTGPMTFTISNKNNIYIPDRANNRLNIYDINLNFLKNIYEKENKECHFAHNLKVDKNENIIALSVGGGHKK